ncbi:trafficking kinesin-binding protein 2-like [Arapaima gigas]
MFEEKAMNPDNDESANGSDKGSHTQGSEPTWFGPRGFDCESLYLYDGQDSVESSSSLPEENSGLSPMLAEETLRYMILSADRAEKMAKTYSDVDMVTHLLAERDRDLELAARIGQSLLQRNHVLQEHNETLEDQLEQALDQVRQLQHELGKKDKLLRMVSSASEESEADTSCPSPQRQSRPLGVAFALSQLEALQSKLQELEEENLTLRSQACHLKTETLTYEEKEQQLVHDCVQELRECNNQMVALTDELSEKNDELLHHQEEISQLLSQIVELQHRVKELALEKEDLRLHLQASKDAQRQLTAELNDLQERNAECLAMLQESQEEIKELRDRSIPSAGLRTHVPCGQFPMDSLAAEIEGSMQRELSIEEDSTFQDQRRSQKRVFQTVRFINQSVRARATTHRIPGSAYSGVVMTAQPFQSSMPATQAQRSEQRPTLLSNRRPLQLGQPGSPGGSDLISALHRLCLRRQNFACEQQFLQAERDRKLRALGEVAGEGEGFEASVEGSSSGSFDGSIVSCVSGACDLATSGSFKTFMPEKLQIVKPIEGSLTLHHWQQLAQPHLATILDPHPGVVTKGFRPLAQDTVYRLTDLEEDGEEEELYNRRVWEKQKTKEEIEGWKDNNEEEEEEGGITFVVPCTFTPVEKTGRKNTTIDFLEALTPSSQPQVSSAPPLASTPSSCSVQGFSSQSSGKYLSSFFSLNSGDFRLCNGHIETIYLFIYTAHNPGKCLSLTFSTYTFTTCRILHPWDVTQVTPSSLCHPLEPGNMPSSLRTGPSTPVTPCRLSLGDSFLTNATAAPRGLAKLLQEKGISAKVSTKSASSKLASNQPSITPPNSPLQSPIPSPVSFEAQQASDNFLASRPAQLFLQDVYGLKLGQPRPDPPQSACERRQTKVGLAVRLQKLGFTKVLQGPEREALQCRDSTTLLLAGGGSLLDRLRRNQSLPTVIGERCPLLTGSYPQAPLHPATQAIPLLPLSNRSKSNAFFSGDSHPWRSHSDPKGKEKVEQ